MLSNSRIINPKKLLIWIIMSNVINSCAASDGPDIATRRTADTSQISGSESKNKNKNKNDDSADQEANNGGVSSDPCAFMRAQSFSSNIGKALAFFCDQGGIQKLASMTPGQLLDLGDSKSGTWTTFTFAGMMVGPGTVETLTRNTKIFCSDFSRYKSMFEKSVYADVKSIVPSNPTPTGCDFQFTGTTTFLFTPKFNGRSELSLDAPKTKALLASYLTQEISLVKASDSVNLAIQEGSNVRVYMWTTSTSDTKGFGAAAKAKIQAGTAAGLRSTTNLMSK